MKPHALAGLAAPLVLLPTFAAAETRTLDVPAFHGIDVSSGIRAVATGGAPHSVVAEAPEAKDLSELRFEVRDGILHLWYDWTIGEIFDWSGRDVTVTVGAEMLDTLTASSGGAIDAKGLAGEQIDLDASSGALILASAIEGMEYDIEASSGAHIEASGLCTGAKADISSGATVAARELDCARVVLEVSSGASLEITARETLRASVSSGGHAAIHGRPRAEAVDSSSGGSIEFKD